jgi:creatinine amidohydrolase
MKVKIEEMTPDELQEAMAKRPVVYVPCGLIEWHGKHLPLGLDGLKIYHTILGCAERTGGVVLPVNWIGAPGFGSFCGTLNYPADLVKTLLTHILGESAKIGAKVIAVVTGHYGDRQVDTVKAAAAEFAEEHPEVRVLARAEYEGVDVDGNVPADHAGMWETSMGLALFPHLVQMDQHRPGEELIPHYGDDYSVWPQEQEPWVWRDDLREIADAGMGEKAVAAIRDSVVNAVEELCREAGV